MKTTKDKIQKDKGKPEKLDTYIGEKTCFDGNLTSKEDVYIYGSVKGTIECQGRVMIGESGKIEADILANDVTVSGNVVGNVTAKNKLEMASNGFIQGNIKTSRLIIKDGGKLEGNCKVLSDRKPSVMEEIKVVNADAPPAVISQKEPKALSGALHN